MRIFIGFIGDGPQQLPDINMFISYFNPIYFLRRLILPPKYLM